MVLKALMRPMKMAWDSSACWQQSNRAFLMVCWASWQPTWLNCVTGLISLNLFSRHHASIILRTLVEVSFKAIL